MQPLGSGFASLSTGKGLKALGVGAFWNVSALRGTGCVLLRDWQHEENLEKGRNAQRVRGTSSSFS